MARILKLRDFARWQTGERLADTALCKVVGDMENGLVDAELGGGLYKMRVARWGGGKSTGYRTLLCARLGERYVFLHGFAKRDQANITSHEKRVLQAAAKALLKLSDEALTEAVQSGLLAEVYCEQNH